MWVQEVYSQEGELIFGRNNKCIRGKIHFEPFTTLKHAKTKIFRFRHVFLCYY